MGAADASTVELFQQDWKLYRKMVDNNFLFLREAYAALHEVLVNDAARPFRSRYCLRGCQCQRWGIVGHDDRALPRD